ncbi:hypothetical protein MTO96_016006 [Rhipicephalus appendiculatus]
MRSELPRRTMLSGFNFGASQRSAAVGRDFRDVARAGRGRSSRASASASGSPLSNEPSAAVDVSASQA